MKKILKTSLCASLLSAPTAAFAHIGSHAPETASGAIGHLVSSPFHVFMIALSIGAVATLGGVLWSRAKEQRKVPSRFQR